MFTTVWQQNAHHAEHQDGSAHVRHPYAVDASGSTARTALSTGCEPNLIPPPRNTNFMSVADDSDEDQMGIQSSQLGKAPSSA